jgi:putative nucleotidyltransferase with HDIG domain
MKRVLFVDDEQHVLDGLRDALRRHRKRWDMRFASDATIAMQWMGDQAFDVVVSDMRMPGMDGAALLAHVKQRHAGTARVILSGQADRDSVLRALPSAHQFLSKPCEPENLIVVIERASALQRLLADPQLRDIVGRIDRLPSAPQLYWELTIAASRPETGMDELVAIVERDPAMSLKVLQLVNSAYFASAQRVSSVQQAVTRLGTDLLKALALVVHAFDSLEVAPFPAFSIKALQEHSFLTARLAKEIACDPATAAEAFATAVLHDVGKLVLATGAPERFARVMQEQRRSRRPCHEIERELLGVTHAEVGAYLLGSWGLPLSMVETVAYHHSPLAQPELDNPVMSAVHVANALVDPASYEATDPRHDGLLDMAYLSETGVADKLADYRAQAARLLAAR